MKALFIGLGSIGQRHLRNLREVAGGSIEVIAYRAKRQVPVLNDKFQVDENANLVEKYNIREFNDLDEALVGKPRGHITFHPSEQLPRYILIRPFSQNNCFEGIYRSFPPTESLIVLR
jgi:hypothetical protein